MSRLVPKDQLNKPIISASTCKHKVADAGDEAGEESVVGVLVCLNQSHLQASNTPAG
jgi:hypothetical protein